MDTNTCIDQLDQLLREVVTYVSGISDNAFFYKEQEKVWSVSEELHHLTLTIFPVNGVLRDPGKSIAKYGRATRPSRSYDQFATEYAATIAQVEWKSFIPFIPKQANEADGYASLHLQRDKAKLDQFYNVVGDQINGLRDKLMLPADPKREDIIGLYEEQAQLLAVQARAQSEALLDSVLLPLPYMGLITLREILYLNLIHNKYHLDRMKSKHEAYIAGA